MERKTIGKGSILIYPIKHANTIPKSTKKELFQRCVSPIYEGNTESSRLKDTPRPSAAKIGEKRKTVEAGFSKLPQIKACKSLSPKFRVDWLDQFISAVNRWENNSKEIEVLQKKEVKLKSSVSQVLKSVEILRKNSNTVISY